LVGNACGFGIFLRVVNSVDNYPQPLYWHLPETLLHHVLQKDIYSNGLTLRKVNLAEF
jgi:hypothetical protein